MVYFIPVNTLKIFTGIIKYFNQNIHLLYHLLQDNTAVLSVILQFLLSEKRRLSISKNFTSSISKVFLNSPEIFLHRKTIL